MSEKLATELGVNVVALDMYDNRIATTSEDAGKLMQSVKTERAMAIIHGAYSYAGSNAKVFTIGWCFGGGWSLQAAIEGGAQAAGCVIYYGMPEKDVNRLKTLQCDVIGFFGEKDQWINAKVVDDFKANMKAAGKNVITYEYNAPHAFANPSNPGHDEAASKDSYEKTIAFIKARMQQIFL
jgi:carboxymethylenebutenolidase